MGKDAGIHRESSTGATLLGLLAIAFWSTSIAFARTVAEQLGTFRGPGAVYLAAGMLGCGVLLATGRMGAVLRKASRRYLVVGGGLMLAYSLLLYLAIGLARTREQIVAVTVANYLWPSLTLLFSVPLLGWKARPVLLAAGSTLGIAGVALAVGADGLRPQAAIPLASHATTTLPALLAAVAWGLYSSLSRRWGGESPHGAMPLFLLLTGAVLFAISCLAAERPAWNGRALAEAAYMAVFPTLLAYVFWDTAARRGDLSLVAASSYLTPLLSVGVSSLYLGLSIRPLQWLAGALVVAGAALCRRSIGAPGRGERAARNRGQ